MPLRPTRAVLALAAAVAVLAGAPAVASAATHTVCPTGCDFTTLPAAVTAAAATDTIEVGEGSYAGGVTIDKQLTITGAGPDLTTITGATVFNLVPGSTGTMIANLKIQGSTATGTSYGVTATGGAVDEITLSNLLVTNARWGIDVRNSATADLWTIEDVTATGNNFGARFWGDTQGLTIDSSHFDGNDYGLYSQYKSRSGTIGVPGVFAGVQIVDSSFDGNSTKGVYLEAADTLYMLGSSVDENGSIPEIRPSGSPSYPRAGIDVNLKYGDFSNVIVADTTVNDTVGSGILIKARDDAPSYADVPASLDGAQLIGVTVTGTDATSNPEALGHGVVFGNNVSGSALYASRLFDNAGGGLLTYVTSGETLDATESWWGCNEGPNTPDCDTVTVQPGTDPVDFDPWTVIGGSADPPGLDVNDQTTVTVELDLLSDDPDAFGGGMPDGTAVTFATDLGSIDPTVVTSCGCLVEATLESGATPGTATVTATLDNETLTIPVVIGPAKLEIAPKPIDFGSVLAGSSSTPIPVVLTNTGGAGLDIVKLDKLGTGQTLFPFSDDSCTGATLESQESCTVDVTFSPVAAGTWNIEFRADTSIGRERTRLLGTGIARVSVDPASWDFGGVLVGGSAPLKEFTVTNNTADPVTVGTPSKSGTGRSQFPINDNDCSTTLAAGESCTVELGFTPASAGSWTPTLHIPTSEGQKNVPLAGQGVNAIGSTPGALDFGAISTGQNAAPQTVTVHNYTGSPATITSVKKSGTGSSLFPITNSTCTGSLPAGGECSFDVGFAPGNVGMWTPKVVVATSAGNSSVDLTGQGV